MSNESRREFLVNYIVDQLVKYLIEDNEMPIEQALNLVYTSRTFTVLNRQALLARVRLISMNC